MNTEIAENGRPASSALVDDTLDSYVRKELESFLCENRSYIREQIDGEYEEFPNFDKYHDFLKELGMKAKIFARTSGFSLDRVDKLIGHYNALFYKGLLRHCYERG